MTKKINLPKRTLRLWQLRLLFPVIIIIGLLIWSCRITPWMLIPLAFFVLLFSFIIFWYLPKFIISYQITPSDDSFTVEMGVFFKTAYIMPYPRLIYVSTVTSPFARLMKVRAVTIRAARGFIVIPEMEYADVDLISAIASGEYNE